MAKYRAVFLEEATEHLEDMSRALLELDRDPARADSIDLVFRMAHSIKGMAASLGYDSIAEVAHRLEDRMQELRSRGRVEGEGLGLLFKGLEGLEAMLAVVRETGSAPPPDPWLARAIAAPVAAARAPAAAGGAPAGAAVAAGGEPAAAIGAGGEPGAAVAAGGEPGAAPPAAGRPPPKKKAPSPR